MRLDAMNGMNGMKKKQKRNYIACFGMFKMGWTLVGACQDLVCPYIDCTFHPKNRIKKLARDSAKMLINLNTVKVPAKTRTKIKGRDQNGKGQKK